MHGMFFFSSLLACLFLMSCSINVKLRQFPKHNGFAFGRWAQHMGALRYTLSIDLNTYTWPPTCAISQLTVYQHETDMRCTLCLKNSTSIVEARGERNVSHILFISMCPLLTCYILFTDWYSSFIHVIPGMLDFILREESYQTRKFYIISALL